MFSRNLQAAPSPPYTSAEASAVYRLRRTGPPAAKRKTSLAWLLPLVVATGLLSPAGTTPARTLQPETRVWGSNQPATSFIGAATVQTPELHWGNRTASSDPALGCRDATRGAAGAVDEAFHHTFGRFVESIRRHGLRPGTYGTPTKGLSPLQAQIELALPPGRGLPGATIRIDVAGLRAAGYEIPKVTRVSNVVRGPGGRVYSVPGGGYEMQFPYAIPPEFISVVP